MLKPSLITLAVFLTAAVVVMGVITAEFAADVAVYRECVTNQIQLLELVRNAALVGETLEPLKSELMTALNQKTCPQPKLSAWW